jgi:hypothetical protein
MLGLLSSLLSPIVVFLLAGDIDWRRHNRQSGADDDEIVRSRRYRNNIAVMSAVLPSVSKCTLKE